MMTSNKLSVSCIVPARNEAGTLKEFINNIVSTVELKEIVIVEGGSIDNTWEICEGLEQSNRKKIKVMQQSSSGKFNAVLEGAKLCSSDYILIWDADGTVPKEHVHDIIRIALEKDSSVIGNRLAGVMENGAMRFANKIGNWVFALFWTPILQQKPIDLLCGTKIFPKEVFSGLPNWLKLIDPYGDFALIAYAKKLHLSIISKNVNYLARKYGKTNIRRWRGGLQLALCTILVYFWILFPGMNVKGENNS